MIVVDRLAEKIFGIMLGFGHQIKLFTEDGQETVDPKDARRFFSQDSGLMVTIDIEEEEVQLSKSNTESVDETKQLQRNLKQLANEFLMNYTVRNYGKSIQPRHHSYKAKIARNNNMGQVAEGITKMTGSKKTSHQTLESVRILVKHKKAVDENVRGSRSRNIAAIFLEQNGERFRFPHNHLAGARAMARHMQEGGSMIDKVGEYVIESVGHLIQLAEFMRYTKTNKLVTEDTTDIIQTVKENIASVKTELHRLTGAKTYESIKTRIEESEDLELIESDTDTLRDMFTVRQFDEKFLNVLPVVHRLVQEKDSLLRRIEESAGTDVFVSEQSNMIDSILEFASDQASFGHKLSNISNRIVENPELAKFVGQVGQKLCMEQEMTAFEQDVISNVLGNMKAQQISETDTQGLQESVQIERFFDKYEYTFL